MHKSRLCAIGIDCETTDRDAAAEFWSAALGRPVEEVEGSYAALEDRATQPSVFVQQVDHPSRVHLDIETDDVEAEVARLRPVTASASSDSNAARSATTPTPGSDQLFGQVKRNDEPSPRDDDTEVSPPLRCTIFRTIARPIPVLARSSRGCSVWNSSQIRPWFAAAMPSP